MLLLEFDFFFLFETLFAFWLPFCSLVFVASSLFLRSCSFRLAFPSPFLRDWELRSSRVPVPCGLPACMRPRSNYIALVLLSVPIQALEECISGCQPFESMPWVDLSLGAPLVLAFVAMVVSRGAETNAVVTSFVTLAGEPSEVKVGQQPC